MTEDSSCYHVPSSASSSSAINHLQSRHQRQPSCQGSSSRSLDAGSSSASSSSMIASSSKSSSASAHRLQRVPHHSRSFLQHQRSSSSISASSSKSPRNHRLLVASMVQTPHHRCLPFSAGHRLRWSVLIAVNGSPSLERMSSSWRSMGWGEVGKSALEVLLLCWPGRWR